MKEYNNHRGQQRRTIDANPKTMRQISLNDALQLNSKGHHDCPIQKFAKYPDIPTAKVGFNTFVLEQHFELINEGAKSGYTLAIRETGKSSVDRIDEGKALPKPHSVLDKSIKSEEDENQLSETSIKFEDVKGYVGYREGTKLCGLVTNVDEGKESDETKKLAEEEYTLAIENANKTKRDLRNPINEYCSYYRANERTKVDGLIKKADTFRQDYKTPFEKLSLEPYKLNNCSGNISHVCIPLVSLPVFQEYMPHTWEKLLYTGDYDMNEIYSENGNIIEEGKEQAKMLNTMNGLGGASIKIKAEDKTLLEGVPQTAIFQHGDQATYPIYFRAEIDWEIKQLSFQIEKLAEELPGEPTDERYETYESEKRKLESKIEVLKGKKPIESLLSSDSGPLAWFDKGNAWYKSNDTDDHKKVRETLKLTPPSGKGRTSEQDESWKNKTT